MVLRYWEPTPTEFDRLVARVTGSGLRATAPAPAADVVTDGEDIVISIELPGLDPADIDIEVAPRLLTVSGERPAPTVADGERVLARGRRHGRFHSRYRLPAGVTGDNVAAAYEHGVLTVRVHRATTPVPAPVKIPVTAGTADAITADGADER